MLTLDGTIGEGGGQLVRFALALSCHTMKPFKMVGIRKSRGKPGLKQQHLSCIKVCQQLTDAYVEGNVLGSEELTFYPRKVQLQDITLDMGTAGSLTLFLQSVLPFLLFQQKKVVLTLTGGTDVSMSMTLDYVQYVLAPHLRRFGMLDILLERRGYVPKGEGKIVVTVKGEEKQALHLTHRGNVALVKGIVHASSDLADRQVVERIVESTQLHLQGLSFPTTFTQSYTQAASTGTGILLYAVCKEGEDIDLTDPKVLGVDMLGQQRVTSEQIGKTVAEQMKALLESDAVVDAPLADNLIPYLGIVGGSLYVPTLTPHVEAAQYVVEQFLPVRFVYENKMLRVEQAQSHS